MRPGMGRLVMKLKKAFNTEGIESTESTETRGT
jgi:hypothetical protein